MGVDDNVALYQRVIERGQDCFDLPHGVAPMTLIGLEAVAVVDPENMAERCLRSEAQGVQTKDGVRLAGHDRPFAGPVIKYRAELLPAVGVVDDLHHFLWGFTLFEED